MKKQSVRWISGGLHCRDDGPSGCRINPSANETSDLSGNYISVTGDAHLSADMARGATPDLPVGPPMISALARKMASDGNLRTTVFIALFFLKRLSIGVADGSPYAVSLDRSPGDSVNTPLSFTNRLINGGAVAFGEPEVTASAGNGKAEIQLDSDNYKPTSASVPDQTSTLALLALGAGGVLAFRQRRRLAAVEIDHPPQP